MWPLLTLSRWKYCPTQLSANKFVPWMLTTFIHSAVVFGCYTATRTNNPPWPLEGIYWTYWHWLIVWTLILTPQFVVLAAFIRVHRLNNERRQNESPSLLLTWRRLSTEVGAFQNIGTPTTAPPQPDVPSRSQYVCLSVDIPETSHLSEDELEDLPPSYSALEPSCPTLPPSYSTLEVNQDAPEYFKTWREQQLSSSFCGKFNKFSGFWNPGNPFVWMYGCRVCTAESALQTPCQHIGWWISNQ